MIYNQIVTWTAFAILAMFLGPIKNISLFAVFSHFGDIVAVFVVLFPLLDGKLAISLQYYCSGCLPF